MDSICSSYIQFNKNNKKNENRDNKGTRIQKYVAV